MICFVFTEMKMNGTNTTWNTEFYARKITFCDEKFDLKFRIYYDTLTKQ